MPVPIQFFSVVVPKKVIQQKYSGGLEQYKNDVPNASYLEDEHLTRVGFMDPETLDYFCNKLIVNGLHFDEDKFYSTDFVVAQYLSGKRWSADWLFINDLGWGVYVIK